MSLTVGPPVEPVAGPPAQSVAAGQAAPAESLASYSDAATGVSFSYPKVWAKAAQGEPTSYLGGQVPPALGAARVAFVFSPAGNLYEKTVLSSLSFSYYAHPAASEQSCVQQVKASGFANATSTVSVGGVGYTELAGGDAAMCHEQSAQVDVTYRGGKCLVFERDFNTECFGAGDGKAQAHAQ